MIKANSEKWHKGTGMPNVAARHHETIQVTTYNVGLSSLRQ